MSTTITRIYDTYGNAMSAMAELKKNGFGDARVALFSNASNSGAAPGSSGEGMGAALAAMGIPASDAKTYSDFVASGKSIVVSKPVFGAGARAVAIMDSHGPTQGLVAKSSYTAAPQSPGTPLSSALGLPVLWPDATPFASFWKMPTLMKSGPVFSNWLTFPTLIKGDGGPWFLFGAPKLVDSPTLISSMFNLPVLWRPKAS